MSSAVQHVGLWASSRPVLGVLMEYGLGVRADALKPSHCCGCELDSRQVEEISLGTRWPLSAGVLSGLTGKAGPSLSR